jgi:hypothetical protein
MVLPKFSAAREFPIPQIDCGVMGWGETVRGAFRARHVVGGQQSVIRHEARNAALIGDACETFCLLSVIK